MKKVLVFGGSGLVASKFIDSHKNSFEIKSPNAEEVDILDKDKARVEVEDFNPDSIVNFAAYTAVEEAEKQKDDEEGICFKVNVLGAKNIAEIAKEFDKHLVQISTEYVFDGTKKISPYIEEDTPNPINWYGKTKYLSENKVFETGCKSTIVRISMPYSSFYELKKDIARFFYEKLKNGEEVKILEDQWITPTLVRNIADGLKVLLENNALGIYHISAKDTVTPLEFVKKMAEVFEFDDSLVSSMTLEEFNKQKSAKLLKYSWLNPAKFEREFGEDILHTVKEDLILFKKEIDSK